MAWLRRISFVAALVVMASSSGCCLFSSCAGGKLGCGLASPGCGLETYYQGGCTEGGCDGCGDGPVIPCRGGSVGCGLGLGCLGQLLGMTHGGCNGCGETYYHGWVNDPPCCDPCDGNGNWIGTPSSPCGCGGVGCDSCGVGGDVGVLLEPGCGVATEYGVVDDCSSCGTGYARTGFRVPGRALYATWTGMGGLVREIRRGFFPSCNRCNNFSLTASCAHCATMDGIGIHEGVSVPAYGYSSEADCPSCAQSTAMQPTPMAQTSTGRLPHAVVHSSMQMRHGRPPHQVVSNRMHQIRR